MGDKTLKGHGADSHNHTPVQPTRRPMTGLDSATDLQPSGNSTRQAEVAEQPVVYGDSWLHHIPMVGPAIYAGEKTVEAVTEYVDQAESDTWWDSYRSADESTRQTLSHEAWKKGNLSGYMGRLSPEEMSGSKGYRNELGETLDYLQQFEMMRASGMNWEEMAQAQSAHMQAEARRAAEEARAASGGDTSVALTPEQIQQAHEDGVADQDYLGEEDTSWWDGLSTKDQTAWNARGDSAVTTWMERADTLFPELGITADKIQVDIGGNSNSVAYVDQFGICHIGQATIEAIERNPSYADSTILHELAGHPEFDTGFALSMELYDTAAATMPGYVQPAAGTAERNEEWTRFEYFESEIGALMREATFWQGSMDLDGNGTIEAGEENTLGSPEALLDMLLGNLSGQFDPRLQGPFIEGLARRFEADPRVTPEASAMFDAAVKKLAAGEP